VSVSEWLYEWLSAVSHNDWPGVGFRSIFRVSRGVFQLSSHLPNIGASSSSLAYINLLGFLHSFIFCFLHEPSIPFFPDFHFFPDSLFLISSSLNFL
jgi:hypothetical protein